MSAIRLPEVQVNSYKKANPLTAKVLENKVLYHEIGGDEVRHIVLDAHEMDYMDGQSAGVLSPGLNEKGNPHAVRLYSIASLHSRAPGAEPMSLCIKRVVYKDETGKEIKGVASNFMCDLKPGDTVNLTGPAGRKFLLPVADDIHRPYIFIATGTGIAPFRGFLQRLYRLTPGFEQPVHLLFGVKKAAELLYDDELSAINHPSFHYHKALSREMKNADGTRYYVHHLLRDKKSELWPLIHNEKTIIYMCGLKGMEEGVLGAINEMAVANGLSPDYAESMKDRIIEEVY